jgi:proteasome lid subunit RPN8/RPN11
MPSLLTKLDILSSEYHTEIGGYLIGDIKGGNIILTDLLIPNQVVSNVSVNINPRDQIDLMKRYGVEKCKKILGHWHSHAGMGCFWSETDLHNMRGIMESKGLYVFIVSSLKRHLIKVCLRNPLNVDFDNVDFELKSLSLDLFRKKVDSILQLSDSRKESMGIQTTRIEEEPEEESEEESEEELDEESEEERRKRLEGDEEETEEDNSEASFYGR